MSLEQLADLDEHGPLFRIAVSSEGDLVLCSPAAPLPKGARELRTDERVHLASISGERPALVVESERGHYVVLVDPAIDLDRYVPLSAGDAELLAHTAARAQFGLRDHDMLMLTAWAEEDEVALFEPDAPDFSDVPIVTFDGNGSLSWVRGSVPASLLPLLRTQLERLGAEPGMRFGVLTNVLGECACVREGTPLLPHEDIRRQTLVGTEGLLDGVETLSAAAARLRDWAERLESVEAAGWHLVHPVVDGVAFLEAGTARNE